MTADHILRLLSGVRSRGDRRWTALCPAHQDRVPSFTVGEIHDRVLFHCFAGCTVEDVCAAIGITVADLFHDHGYKPDPVVLRRQRAVERLEQWRQDEIRRCAGDLRTRDTIIRQIDRAVRDALLTTDEALIPLEHEYRGYSDLEDRLDQLIRNQSTLGLWRESRVA